MVQILVPKLEEVKIELDGSRIVLHTKNAIIKTPWQVIKTLTKAMLIQAGRAEELANLPRLVQDHAIMMRTGAPFGLTNDPDIQKEAAKVAQYDPKLRRYLPGGVKGTALLGTPTLIKHPPKEAKSE